MDYQIAVTGSRKGIPPTVDAHAAAGSAQADWERWVSARVAYDNWLAANAAAAANTAALGPRTAPSPPRNAAPAIPPAPPGPIPPTLLAACGNPPAFASAVAPLQHTITFDDPGDTYTYQDNPKMRDRYAYYRSPLGTRAYGPMLREMPAPELDALFRKAGFSPSDQRILTAVSGLEGGFDAINTYDTGFVSIGFIQFITGSTGSEDLAQVMLREKTDSQTDFQNDFHRFGMDIQPVDGMLTVVDPTTGAELVGRDAVLKVIEDKRLTAIFQRAGRRSTAFRVAQIETARASYWPTDDPIRITLDDGTQLQGKVGEIIHSEAGLATLVDRKVNTGHLNGLNEAIAQAMRTHHCKKLSETAAWEREIVQAVKFRRDFLADPSLGQPAGASAKT